MRGSGPHPLDRLSRAESEVVERALSVLGQLHVQGRSGLTSDQWDLLTSMHADLQMAMLLGGWNLTVHRIGESG